MLSVRRYGHILFSGHHGSLFPRYITRKPNARLNLDTSFQSLLDAQDISLRGGFELRGVRLEELEEIPGEQGGDSLEISGVEKQDDWLGLSLERKSPAAHYGSQQIGQVILPNQLQNAISGLITESDRTQLRSDAKRLFYEERSGRSTEGNWNTGYEVNKYHSHKQASRHSERDGTAFASIALPAHYSAILAVFEHIKRRLEPTWKVERVIDWGAGTGSGLWAALHAFQHPGKSETPIEDKQITDSSLTSFLGIEKRDGLVSIGKRLLRGIVPGTLNVSWQRFFKENDRIPRSEGHDTIALSAFMLTSLGTPQERKTLVKEMWESGAHVMVLIDHNNKEGFEAIAQAREYLLTMGRREFENIENIEVKDWPLRGSHVVAPCPHDGSCPLYQSGSSQLVCGFSQRIQRPSFVRRTKHSGIGHEDVEYSYVIIRRGCRPSPSIHNLGRMGEVGQRALEKEALANLPLKELQLYNESPKMPASCDQEMNRRLAVEKETVSIATLNEALRLEAFNWPRLIVPPLKRSGHVILDSCTADGKIMRMTIPKSQGRQPYYDARKSSWGDLFPHPPKNPPQERCQPRSAGSQKGSATGSDIGKRGVSDKKDRPSYGARRLKSNKKKSRRESNLGRTRNH